MNKNQPNIMVLNPHPIVFHGLEILLKDQPNLTLCWKGSDTTQAWKALDKSLPDLLILDLSLNNADGIDFIKNIHAFWPKLPVLVFSSREETFYAERALRAGAKGYLMKDQPTAALLTAIRTLLKGEVYLTERMRDRMVTRALSGRHSVHSSPWDRLTDRELEVFRLLGLGYRIRDTPCRRGTPPQRQDDRNLSSPYYGQAQSQEIHRAYPSCIPMGQQRFPHPKRKWKSHAHPTIRSFFPKYSPGPHWHRECLR